VRIDVGCCDEMLYAAVVAGCRYDEDEVLAYTAALASKLALQPQSDLSRNGGWDGQSEPGYVAHVLVWSAEDD
jgi:hypothetical protein